MKPLVKVILTLILISVICIAIMLAGAFIPTIEKNKESRVPNPTINATIPVEKLNLYAASLGTFTINAPVPNYSSNLPVYRGFLREGDSIDLQFQTIGKIRKNVTPPKEADQVSRKVMAPYGGIPADAVFEGAETEYVEQYNGTSETVEARWPVVTSVSYFRLINSMYVIGDSNRINLDLGEDGESFIGLQNLEKLHLYRGCSYHFSR